MIFQNKTRIKRIFNAVCGTGDRYVFKSGLLCILLLMANYSLAWGDQFPAVVEAEHRAVLAAEREGVLSKLEADVGDEIRRGGVLAVVFHQDLVLRKEQNQATQDYLLVLVENLRKLSEKGMVTDEELAKAEMDLAVNAKEIRLIETQIERSRITAPFSGLVTMRHTQPFEWVRPGQPVLEIYDPSKLRIVTDIPSDIALKLEKGQTKTLYFPDLNKEISATLAVFAPQVDVRSNTIKVYWGVDGRDGKRIGLKPGMKGVLKVGA